MFAIADAGDAIIVPAPYYLGFDMDTRVRSSVSIFPAHRSQPSFVLTHEALSAAAAEARAAGKTLRALLICSPDNPTGRLLLPEEIQLAAQFARENSLHFICDEIYAKSVFASDSAPAFASSADLLRSDLESGRLHILYARPFLH
jgi:aspartate/methionine/tyrosine aminotransferase